MNTLEEFKTLVTSLWPRYKTTDGELQPIYDRVRRHGTVAIGEMLRNHKYDDPDAYKPTWKTVFGMLNDSQSSAVTKKSALATTINMTRALLRDHPIKGRPPEKDWSDRDILELHIQIQTQQIWTDAKGNRVTRDHPEWERRDQLVRHQEYRTRRSFAQELEDRDEAVPDYVLCERPHDMLTVEESLVIINRMRKSKGISKVMATAIEADRSEGT